MVRCKIHKKDREKFIKLATQLNDLMEKIAEYCPEGELFVSGESTTDFNLCDENTTNRKRGQSTKWCDEHLIETITVNHCDCGGW